MKRIRCKLADRSYTVYVAEGLLKKVGEIIAKEGVDGKIMLITNKKISSLYYDIVEKGLKKRGYKVYRQFVPDGESAKSQAELFKIYASLIKCGFDRYSAVLALGGGVVGDLSAFAASTFMRGITFINVPTTLLAQVDSAIGGKTAINLPEGKNLVGTFYQPRCVLSDVSVLKSLPKKVLAGSLSEVIKYGVIEDASFFSYLEKNMERALNRNLEVLQKMVSVSSKIKVEVVEEDERETSGRRAILNFGHTFAHGFEAACGYENISHGEAVGIGMIAAARLAERHLDFSAEDSKRIEALVKATGISLSLKSRGILPDKVMHFMHHDKKNKGKKITFILPEKIGQVGIYDNVPGHVVDVVLKEIYAEF